MRAAAVEALNDLGYSVLEAPDGPAALDVLSRRGDVTLLITDMIMPGMTGRELATKACAFLPQLKVLYISGYTPNGIVHGGRLDPGVALLSKPFSYDQLARKVKAVLDGTESGQQS